MNDFDPRKLRDFANKKKDRATPPSRTTQKATTSFGTTFVAIAATVIIPTGNRTQQATGPSITKRPR